MFGNKNDKIAKLVEKKKADKILHYLNDKDISVVLAAIKGLGDCATEEGYNGLVPLLHNQNADIRAAAAAALGVAGISQGRTHLAYQLKNETDEKVQAAIRSALDIIQDKR